MHVDCEGCAGCCIDWRPIAPVALDHGRRGLRASLDDTHNFVPLTRGEIRDSVEAGFDNALSPRLREAPPGKDIEIDGVETVAVDGKLVFFVGMRKLPKPVVPFGLEWMWLRTRAFPDPEILQCRTHDTEFYPGECAEYPGHNLVLEQEIECERVERHHGGGHLSDDAAPDDLRGLLPGPHALGAKLLAHPESERLVGTIDHLKHRELTPEDHMEFVGVTVGPHPGLIGVDGDRASRVRAKTLEDESWAGEAVAAWGAIAGRLGGAAGDASDPDEVEVARGVPETPGWGVVRDDG